jgi:hypothetical protein
MTTPATLDEAIARELARHSSDPQAACSLDDALTDLARECWRRAEAMTDPQAVATAVCVNVDTPQCWAVWFMAQHLFDMSVYDPARRCVGACEPPSDARPGWPCPAADDTTHAACARSLVFPYRHTTHDRKRPGHLTRVGNQSAAATAIVRGFKHLGFFLTISAVRQILTKFSETH